MLHQPTVYSPSTLAEALSVLAGRGDSLKIIAGGTDLMVLLNAHLLDARDFLDIWKLDELRGITEDQDSLRIGALTTYTQIIRSRAVQTGAPALIEASRTVGAIQIQNRGTLGGNIVNASPAGDTLPVLAAYDAEVEVASTHGVRRVPFNEFYTGYRKTVLAPDELVLAVRVPRLREGERDFYWKVGTRRAQAISKTVMAIKAAANGKRIDSIGIGIGSVAPTVIRARATEALLNGSVVSSQVVSEARLSLMNEVKPISDLRSTEYYRRTVTANLLVKFLRQFYQ